MLTKSLIQSLLITCSNSTHLQTQYSNQPVNPISPYNIASLLDKTTLIPEFQRTLRSTQSPLTSVNIPIYLNTIFPLPPPNKLSLKPLNPNLPLLKRKKENVSTSSVASSTRWHKLSFPFLKLPTIYIQSGKKS